MFGMAICGDDAWADNARAISKNLTKLEKRVTKLEVTLPRALRGKNGNRVSADQVSEMSASTSWSGTIYNPSATGVSEKAITVTFTPATESTGTWTSTPYNLVTPALAFWDPSQQANYSGEYKLIQNSMFFFNVVSSGDAGTGTAGSVVVDVKDTGLLLTTFSSSLPSPLLELKPQ